MENQLSTPLFGTVCLISERFDSFGNHKILQKASNAEEMSRIKL